MRVKRSVIVQRFVLVYVVCCSLIAIFYNLNNNGGVRRLYGTKTSLAEADVATSYFKNSTDRDVVIQDIHVKLVESIGSHFKQGEGKTSLVGRVDENSTMPPQSDVQESRKTAVIHSSSKTDLYSVFNDSCPTNVLGIPAILSAVCRFISPIATNASPSSTSISSTSIDESICRDLTCRKLIMPAELRPGLNVSLLGDDVLYKNARDFMNRHATLLSSSFDRTFAALTSDCQQFRLKRGYEHKMNILEDQDFSIAFNFLIHRNAEQVERLLYALYRPQHKFCLHIDLKSSDTFKMALHALARCLPNVFIASKLENVVYSGYSRLQADINCMKDHIERGGNWRYVINTAGEAFPLRSQREMIQILRLYNGSNDVEGIFSRWRMESMKYLYEVEFEENTTSQTVLRTGRRNPKVPHEIEIVKGSAYGAFSRAFVEFILTDQRALDFLDWCRKTYSPDEFYWATLNHHYVNPHLHTPGAYRGYPTQKWWTAVYANWGMEPCRGQFVRGICVVGVGDLPLLVRRHELFVNKFFVDFEPLALECVRAWIEHKDICPLQFSYDFYQKRPR